MRLPECCVIVASSPSQAAEIRGRLDVRLEAGLYPRQIEFLVLSDPADGRVGSGGAAILAAYALRERLEGGGAALVINAGGESRRMPAYAPEGKLFAPIPLPSSTRIPPVLLDLQLGLFLRYPWNEGELLVSSGDVAIDFSVDQLPSDRGDLYGFAKPDSFELGSEHGVFKFDHNRNRVIDFFQKEPVDFLKEHAALEGMQGCALDIGMVGFGPRGRKALYAAAESRLSDGETLLALLESGRAEVDLYVELLMAFLSGVSREDYLRKVGNLSKLPADALSVFHGAFQDLDFRAFLTRNTHFLHFGSLGEYPQSCKRLTATDTAPFYVADVAELRAHEAEGIIGESSVDTTCQRRPGVRQVLFEGCVDSDVLEAGGGNLFVGLDGRRFVSPIPAGICLDERATPSGRYLLVYATGDTWRPQSTLSDLSFCGQPVDRWAQQRGIDPESLFEHSPSVDGRRYDLWDARLYVAGADEEFSEGYWDPTVASERWRKRFAASPRKSIREVSAAGSLAAREERRIRIRERLLRDNILGGEGWISIPEADFRTIFSQADIETLERILERTDDDLLAIYRRRLLESLRPEGPKNDSVANLNVEYLVDAQPQIPLRRSVKLDQIVWARSSVRLDLAGGWTDTPPFTLREGGEVVNVAVRLNGQPPVQVFCRPTGHRDIRIHSIDLGVGETILRFEALEDFANPASSFALPKAALVLLGLTRRKTGGAELGAVLERIGFGLELTLLSAVPKGSGLGTSSILGATILAALERFYGLEVTREELFRQVLQLEQMLTTGGGWQDQIGGVAGGVKYIVSSPGLKPDPLIYQLDPYLFQDPSCASRFTLYYTGITRLAKNILQEVVDQVNGMEPAYLFTLRYLKRLAQSAREAISRRDLMHLSRLLNASWQENKRIHPSTTNDEVEALLERVSGLYSGMKLLGAGGGGFVLFLSESAETALRLRERLTRFEHDRARLVDMEIDPHGLRVTVS